jgi:hypothetical protein
MTDRNAMTGKRYYLTTLDGWQRHAARFANSHFIALDSSHGAPASSSIEAAPETISLGDTAPILALIEADEGVHLALEDDAAFEALPHPLTQKPISARAQAALAAHGVPPGATTFEAAEALARLHPLIRHRVF